MQLTQKAIVERLTVIPSAQTLEAPYIQRNINATRAAYGVGNVKTVPYNATTTAKAGALKTDAETTASIPILEELARRVLRIGQREFDHAARVGIEAAEHVPAPSKLALPEAVIQDHDRCCSPGMESM